ncbi:MAG: DUF2258 domain-containing protein [Thermoproteota archaeon]|nr:MAG: DUF2258 domain-containing protein [Candidatus Korarchaeota archaeon]RLG52152.1 MAG: DUF2258 domain-containing protein [Candidatus Korarchaeota archaeon]
MPTLSTGYIIVGAYADKLRKTLFAQQSSLVKSGELDSKELARAAGELNRVLFDILVNKLNLDKGDVVRVRIGYEVEDRTVKWKYSTLSIEAFRRVDQGSIDKVVEEAISAASAEAGASG